VVAAQCRVAHKSGHVYGWLRLVNCFNIFCKCRITKGCSASEQVHRVRRRTFERYGRCADAAIAHDNRGDALRELGKHRGMVDHGCIVVRMCVNKSRRKGQASGVENALGFGRKRWSYALNSIARECDIKNFRCAAAAVEDGGVAQKCVGKRHGGSYRL
jgi:hypothetical protein